jgi:hypothetical protein
MSSSEQSHEDYRDLDAAFTLPDVIEDQALRGLYEVLVARMRDEASHLPMSTVQQLLIERIAYNYIVLRWYEMRQMFAHTTAQKDFNTFWLSMTQEFNRQLRAQDDAARNALLKQIFAIISDTLSGEDSEVSDRLSTRFSQALAEQGF